MKKLAIALSFFFALSASAQAQKSKSVKADARPETTIAPANSQSAIDTAAQKDLNNLMTTLNNLDPYTQKGLKELFVTKHSMLSENLSEERKKAVTESMEYRLSLLLDPASLAKVKADQNLYNSLIN